MKKTARESSTDVAVGLPTCPSPLAAWFCGLATAVLGGCSRGETAAPTAPKETTAAVAGFDAAVAGGRARPTAATAMSAPIGAARIHGVYVVAGLVVGEGVLTVAGLGERGPIWTADVLHDIAWAPDAEVKVQPISNGVAVLWRGLRAGRPTRTLVTVGPNGEARGEPVELGPMSCVTLEGLAWTRPTVGGPTRVMARRWADPDVREVLRVPADHEPSLLCGDHNVVLLADGDEEMTASAFVPGTAPSGTPVVVMRHADFKDDEREHQAWPVGDELGLLRIGVSGAIALRVVPRGGPPAPWQALKQGLLAADDVVAMSAAATAVVLVVTRDGEVDGGSPGSFAVRARAIRVDRATGDESTIDFGLPETGRLRGPFWIDAGPAGPVVSWLERRANGLPQSTSIVALAFREIRSDGVRAGRIEQGADALVSGGCDEHGCAAVALARDRNGDDGRAGRIRIVHYP